MAHIRRETVWCGIAIQDHDTTRGKLSKSWGICQVFDRARLATTIHNTGDGSSSRGSFERIIMANRRPQSPDREKEADHRWKSALLRMRACRRCGGLLTRGEDFSQSIENEMPSLRCVQCGECLDEIILRNRVMSNRMCNRRESPNQQPSLRM